MRSRACLLVLVILMGLVLVPGCGGRYVAPVKGRVTCNGKPVTQAAIVFSPVPENEEDREAGKPATGFSEADGTFVLSTYKPLDGALVGKHRVTISLEDNNPARCKRSVQVTREVTAGQNDFEIELNQ